MSKTNSILCVGLVCIDNVFIVEEYPEEDSDLPCQDHYRSRGGNASNNCTVLSDLGIVEPEFVGAIAGEPKDLASFVEKDFQENKIITKNCQFLQNEHWPQATVISSKKTGSRTIIYAGQNMPELTLEHFHQTVIPEKYKWIHFEARGNVREMLEHLNLERFRLGLDLSLSVEIEKTNQGLEILIPLSDLIFISKDFAIFDGGVSSPEEGVKKFKHLLRKGGSLICTWGDQGVAGYDGKFDQMFRCPACKPSEIVDSLGAGDTFNATVLASLLLHPGLSLESAAKIGCQVTAFKIARRGFRGLKETFQKSLEDFGLPIV